MVLVAVVNNALSKGELGTGVVGAGVLGGREVVLTQGSPKPVIDISICPVPFVLYSSWHTASLYAHLQSKINNTTAKVKTIIYRLLLVGDICNEFVKQHI